MRRLLVAEDFDLIILDLGLPGLGGIEACRRIRASRANAVVMSVTASTSELEAVAGCGRARAPATRRRRTA